MNERIQQVINDVTFDVANIRVLPEHADSTRELEAAALALHGAVLRASTRK